MKTVYRIESDVNNFQYFIIDNVDEIEQLDTDCRKKNHIWVPPKVMIYKPFLEVGDFYELAAGALVVSPNVLETNLRYSLEFAGEILPLPYKGQTFSFINVLRCYDCLDKEKTVWRPSGLPDKYVFREDLLPDPPGLFKIPETHTGEVLLFVDTTAPEVDNFKLSVEKLGLKGLIFKELWSSEG